VASHEGVSHLARSALVLLGDTHPDIDYEDTGKPFPPEPLHDALMPIIKLVHAIITATTMLDQVTESRSRNTYMLPQYIRASLPKVTTIQQSAALFQPFGIEVTVCDEPSSAISFQKRFGKEFVVLRHAIYQFLMDWKDNPRRKQVRTWPCDFTDEERTALRAVVAEYVSSKQIDTTIRTQPDNVIKEAVESLMGMQNFPVPEAHRELIMEREFITRCYNLRTMERVKAEKRDARQGALAGDENQRLIDAE
jgi:hypothetical protein